MSNITELIKELRSKSGAGFLDDLGQFALSLSKPGIKKEDFLNLKYNENTVSDYFKSMISKIGENLVLNDLQIIDIKNLNYSFYVHNSYKKI